MYKCSKQFKTRKTTKFDLGIEIFLFRLPIYLMIPDLKLLLLFFNKFSKN